MLPLTISMLFVYLIIIAYVIWRSIHVIKGLGVLFNKKRVYLSYTILIIALASTLILGGVLPKSAFTVFCHKFSNYWLGFLIIHIFSIVVVDLVISIMRVIDKYKHEIKFLKRPAGFRTVAIIVWISSAILTAGGFIHAHTLTERSYYVTIDKPAGEMDDVRIVLVSDMHLGYSIGYKDMEKMVEAINEKHPDLVIVAGDIYDNEYEAIDDPQRCAEILRGIKSRYGTYAIYGNHDVDATLIGGFTVTPNSEAFRDQRLVQFAKDCGFTMLEDEYTLINDSFYLMGRIDLELTGDGTSDHAEIAELTKPLDKSKPVICITHEPDELDETADAGVDLLLCGHTHAGQFFPLTVVQPLRWKNYWGYKKFGDMHNIVTSGVGVYGPNMRLFTDSEIVVVNVSFNY